MSCDCKGTRTGLLDLQQVHRVGNLENNAAIWLQRLERNLAFFHSYYFVPKECCGYWYPPNTDEADFDWSKWIQVARKGKYLVALLSGKEQAPSHQKLYELSPADVQNWGVEFEPIFFLNLEEWPYRCLADIEGRCEDEIKVYEKWEKEHLKKLAKEKK
jgi:hypothetical protein